MNPLGSDDIEPSPAQLERWQRAFTTELAATRRRARVRRFGIAAGAAAAAALALVLVLPGTPTAPATPVARVQVAFGGVVVREDGEVLQRLAPGAIVRDGQRVESGQRSGLGVVYAGGVVRLDEQTEVIFRRRLLELISGGVYLDSDPHRAASPGALRVQTPAGIISHVGTQFLVRVSGNRVEAAVREGGIVLHQGDREVLLEAAADGAARRLVVGDAGEVLQDDAAATGELWAWALRTAAGMSLQGQSADAVLRWSAREQGRRLVYDDARSEALARQVVLSGFREPVDPVRAVGLVDAATGLAVDASDPQVLRVFVPSESDQHAY